MSEGTPWAPTSRAPTEERSGAFRNGELELRREKEHWLRLMYCVYGLTSLPNEVKELVRAQLEAGHFQSVDEVVCAALRLLHEREEHFASHREALRAHIAEGVAAEERGEPRYGGEAIAAIRRRIDERLRGGE